MTENITQTTQYAIELPSGDLVADLGSWDSAGGVYSTLPGGQTAYLWDTPDGARTVRRRLATDLEAYGLQTYFMQRSRISEVQVRTVTTLVIHPVIADDEVAVDPVQEGAVAKNPEPRTWSSVIDIPVGTHFYGGFPDSIYLRRENDCLHVSCGSQYQLTAFGSAPDGFTEVLP